MKERMFAATAGAIAVLTLAYPVMAQYEGEILFRGIPWGTDYNSIGDVFDGNRLSDYEGRSYANKVSYLTGVDYDCAENEGTGDYVYVSIDHPIQVAGYNVDSIYLYFANIFANGNVSTKECGTYLYGGVYEIECENYEGARNDLVGKLSGLYGDYTTSESDIGDTHIYRWDGANDTHCALKASDEYETIEIDYADGKGDMVIDAADAAIDSARQDRESEIYGNGDNSGL